MTSEYAHLSEPVTTYITHNGTLAQKIKLLFSYDENLIKILLLYTIKSSDE